MFFYDFFKSLMNRPHKKNKCVCIFEFDTLQMRCKYLFFNFLRIIESLYYEFSFWWFLRASLMKKEGDTPVSCLKIRAKSSRVENPHSSAK